MTEALGNVTVAFDWITSRFTSMVDVIIGEPALLIPVAIFAVGACIGLATRLIRG